MAAVTVEINGQSYAIGCLDGQERRLQELARGFDRTVRQVAEEVGSVGDMRLTLMAALVVADELADARAAAARAQEELRRARDQLARSEARAATALDAAARRVEELAQKLG